MLEQLLLIASTAALLIYIKNYKINKVKKKVMDIVYRNGELINRQAETIKIINIFDREYGYDVLLQLPGGITSERFEKCILSFKEALNLQALHLKKNNNFITMHCIKDYKYKDYRSVKLPPYCLLIGNSLSNNIYVDMTKYPHCLIGGETGAGKSRLLFTMLTNLIANSCNNIELYLLQIRKSDLSEFQDVRCVKSYSKTLEQVRASLSIIDAELIRRDELIEIRKGYYNINDYNNKSQDKLKYIYVVIEEFSFLNINRADTQYEKNIKAECLKYIKSIVNTGRSCGVFLITSLQKPTADSIPSDIKAQLTTRISMKIIDSPASIVILGNDKATDLGYREFICRTLEEEKGFSITIDHNNIINAINPYIEIKSDISEIIPPPYNKKDKVDINKIMGVIK